MIQYFHTTYCAGTFFILLLYSFCLILKRETLVDILVSSSGYVQCGAIIMRSIFSQIFTEDTHSSPVRARYRVSFVDSASD